MMFYIVAFIGGFIAALLWVSSSDIKSNIRQKRRIKRYQKLINGKVKETVDIRTMDYAFHYRHYPFLINGEVAYVPNNEWQWWHCNDEYIRLVNTDNQLVGYLKQIIVRSRRCNNNTWFHYKCLSVASASNMTGKPAKVSAIVEVY